MQQAFESVIHKIFFRQLGKEVVYTSHIWKKLFFRSELANEFCHLVSYSNQNWYLRLFGVWIEEFIVKMTELKNIDKFVDLWFKLSNLSVPMKMVTINT